MKVSHAHGNDLKSAELSIRGWALVCFFCGKKEMLERREFIRKSVLWGSYALGAVAIGYPVFLL